MRPTMRRQSIGTWTSGESQGDTGAILRSFSISQQGFRESKEKVGYSPRVPTMLSTESLDHLDCYHFILEIITSYV